MSTAHHAAIDYEPPSARHSGALVLHGGHRARCSCGWWSDCYAQMSDARRAIEVHVRRSQRLDFEVLIEKSSIGAGVADIKKRGIDAHLADLEHEMRSKRRGQVKKKAKRARRLKPLKPEEAAFMRGFGAALATIWRCQHDGQMVRMLIAQNNFTIDAFRGVDLMDVDFKAIQQAVKR
jgi:hypothetical protein